MGKARGEALLGLQLPLEGRGVALEYSKIGA